MSAEEKDVTMEETEAMEETPKEVSRVRQLESNTAYAHRG
jgi:hypothetical protein